MPANPQQLGERNRPDSASASDGTSPAHTQISDFCLQNRERINLCCLNCPVPQAVTLVPSIQWSPFTFFQPTLLPRRRAGCPIMQAWASILLSLCLSLSPPSVPSPSSEPRPASATCLSPGCHNNSPTGLPDLPPPGRLPRWPGHTLGVPTPASHIPHSSQHILLALPPGRCRVHGLPPTVATQVPVASPLAPCGSLWLPASILASLLFPHTPLPQTFPQAGPSAGSTPPTDTTQLSPTPRQGFH